VQPVSTSNLSSWQRVFSYSNTTSNISPMCRSLCRSRSPSTIDIIEQWHRQQRAASVAHHGQGSRPRTSESQRGQNIEKNVQNYLTRAQIDSIDNKLEIAIFRLDWRSVDKAGCNGRKNLDENMVF
jgi:hypothetical protein